MQPNRKLSKKKRVKRKEADLMGFKLIINNQGQFITELKTYPKDKSKAFNGAISTSIILP